MSVTAATHFSTSTTTRPASSLRRETVVSGLLAGAATTAAAAALSAAGVTFEIEGEMVPLLGFAQMTFLGAVLGGLILTDQNRALWTRSLIAEGHALVRSCLRRDAPGPFQIQAAIAAVHADAASADATDWSQIVALYDQLFDLRPNPVVALNRAIAMGELHGPAIGLETIEALDAGALATYQPYHAARADLLARTGHGEAALAAYDRAIALTTNPAERAFLEAQRETTA